MFITGASGSGKTTLALALLGHCALHGIFGRLVSDDQVLLKTAAGRLMGSTPQAIAGLVEAHGLGPAQIVHEPATLIDLMVRLVPEEQAPRVEDGEEAKLEGVVVPCLLLPARNAAASSMAIAARLRLAPFG